MAWNTPKAFVHALHTRPRLFEYGFFLLLGVIMVLLWFPKAFFNDLYYDEGAAWHVAVSTSAKDLLFGNYTHVGDMPLPYLMMKPWFALFRTEFADRLLFMLISGIGLVYAYKIFRIFEQRRLAVLGTILLALSPLYADLSVLIRSYIIGMVFQIVSFYYFCRIVTGKPNRRLLVLYSVFATAAAFSGFSSIYLLTFFLVVFLFLAWDKKENRRLFLSAGAITGGISVAAALWITAYVMGPNGQRALTYYVGYGAHNLIGYATQALRELVLYVPYWNGFWPDQWFMDVPVLEPLAVALSFVFTVLSFRFGIDMVLRLLSRRTIAGLHLFAGAASIVWILSLLCSLLFVNVLFARLLFFLVLPWIYGILTVTKFLMQKRLYAVCGLFVACILLLDIVGMVRYWQLVPFPTETAYQMMVQDTGKRTLLITSEFAKDSLDFYERKHTKELYRGTDMYFTSGSLPIQTVPPYDTIFYFGYYDMWFEKNPSAYRQFQTTNAGLTKRTLLQSTRQEFFLQEFTRAVQAQ